MWCSKHANLEAGRSLQVLENQGMARWLPFKSSISGTVERNVNSQNQLIKFMVTHVHGSEFYAAYFLKGIFLQMYLNQLEVGDWIECGI
jgi:hypothetical protein